MSVETNERLTRVGSGTPCGDLMRRYWIPIAPAARLNEKPVQKVRVPGEDLLRFRSERGPLGLNGERCLHRTVDLPNAIQDEDGLRCPYLGWLYGTDGRCLDTPLENPLKTFKYQLHFKAHPVQELGGLIFSYLGPQPAPLLPRWDLFVWPNAVRQIGISVLNCSWLQCHENTGDPLHSVWLHGSGRAPVIDQGPNPLGLSRGNAGGLRAQHRKGLVMDDADRYGPAVPLVRELHRRIEVQTAVST